MCGGRWYVVVVGDAVGGGALWPFNCLLHSHQDMIVSKLPPICLPLNVFTPKSVQFKRLLLCWSSEVTDGGVLVLDRAQLMPGVENHRIEE